MQLCRAVKSSAIAAGALAIPDKSSRSRYKQLNKIPISVVSVRNTSPEKSKLRSPGQWDNSSASSSGHSSDIPFVMGRFPVVEGRTTTWNDGRNSVVQTSSTSEDT